MTGFLLISEVLVSVLSETLSWSSDKCHLRASQDDQEQDRADLQAVSHRTWSVKLLEGCSDLLERRLKPLLQCSL